MNIKNVAFSFLIFLSTLVCCSNNEVGAERQEEVLQSLYEKEIAFSALDRDTVRLYTQILKENKIILKHTIAHQTGFFNVDIVIGIIGIWFGAQ